MKTKNDFFGTGYAEIVCGVVVSLGQWLIAWILEGKVKNDIFRNIIAAVLAIFVAAWIAYLTQQLIFNIAKKSRRSRQKLYPIAKYEGKWIEYVPATNEYAICSLEYEQEEEEYYYRGCLYQKTKAPQDFKSSIVIYKNNYLHYITDGTHVEGVSGLVPCYGKMHIQNNNTADGMFNDLLDNMPCFSFRMRMIDKKVLDDYNEKHPEAVIKNVDEELDNEETARAFIAWFDGVRSRYM